MKVENQTKPDFFNKILEFSEVLEMKRKSLKDNQGENWSYRGFAKYTGINHRHLARVLKPKEFYTFLTLLDVMYPLGFKVVIPDSDFEEFPSKYTSLEEFKEKTLLEISMFVKLKMKENKEYPLSQRALGSKCGLAHTQVKGVIQGSKNYNITTLLKVLEVFDTTIYLEERKS